MSFPKYPKRLVVWECGCGHHHPSSEEAWRCYRWQEAAWFASDEFDVYIGNGDAFTAAVLAMPERRALVLHYARSLATTP